MKCSDFSNKKLTFSKPRTTTWCLCCFPKPSLEKKMAHPSARDGGRKARRDNIADESYGDGAAPSISVVPKSGETIARIESALTVRC